MISHRDLLGLTRLADYFPLIGDYLRGATTEVQFETDRGDQFRTHIIVDDALFPSVMIAVEGSDSAVVARRFFALPEFDFAHFVFWAGGHRIAQKMSSAAMNSSARSIESLAGPSGPDATQRSFQSDQ